MIVACLCLISLTTIGRAQATGETDASPGDAAGSIIFTSNRGPAFGRQTTTPVTLRSLVPNGPTSFRQTLTGGNGRSPSTGRTFYYQLDVPSGRPELNATVTLLRNSQPASPREQEILIGCC